MQTTGLAEATVLDTPRAAGLTHVQITEVLLVIAGMTFTNLFNRINDTITRRLATGQSARPGLSIRGTACETFSTPFGTFED